MGSSSSTVTDEQINNIINSVIVNNVTTCKTPLSQQQKLDFQNVRGNVDINGLDWSQYANLNLTCVGSNNSANKIRSAVEQELDQLATSHAGFFSTSSSSSKSNNQLINNISNEFTNNNIQECASGIAQSQNITAKNISGNVVVEDVNWEQSATSIADCMFNNETVSENSNQLVSNINQSSSATSEGPLDTLTTLFNSLLASIEDILAPLGIAGGAASAISSSLVCCCICCCCILIVLIIGGVIYARKS
jgi:hypothetical protein